MHTVTVAQVWQRGGMRQGILVAEHLALQQPSGAQVVAWAGRGQVVLAHGQGACSFIVQNATVTAALHTTGGGSAAPWLLAPSSRRLSSAHLDLGVAHGGAGRVFINRVAALAQAAREVA